MAAYGYDTTTLTTNFKCGTCVQNADKSYNCQMCSASNATGLPQIGDSVIFSTTVTRAINLPTVSNNFPNPNSLSLTVGDKVLTVGRVSVLNQPQSSIGFQWLYVQKAFPVTPQEVFTQGWIVPDAILRYQFGDRPAYTFTNGTPATYNTPGSLAELNAWKQDVNDWIGGVGFTSNQFDPNYNNFNIFTPSPPQFISFTQWNSFLDAKQLVHYSQPNRTQIMPNLTTSVRHLYNE